MYLEALRAEMNLCLGRAHQPCRTYLTGRSGNPWQVRAGLEGTGPISGPGRKPSSPASPASAASPLAGGCLGSVEGTRPTPTREGGQKTKGRVKRMERAGL